jgi:quinol-cytochrome oxidoreductase complex cytochrome b subunit
MICNLYMNLMPINVLWSMSSHTLCLHMFAQHVVLVGFVVIVVISLTLGVSEKSGRVPRTRKRERAVNTFRRCNEAGD